MKPAFQDACCAVSLTTLALLNTWRLLFDHSYTAPVQRGHLGAVLSASAILSIVFWCGAQMTRRRSGRFGYWLAKWLFIQLIVIFMLASIYRASGLVVVVANVLHLPWTLPVIVIPVVLASIRSMTSRLAMILIALSPCGFFVSGRAVLEMFRTSPSPYEVRGSMEPLTRMGPRVLLIVFDELSEGVAFANRPPGIDMPAFDRLSHEAVVASAAYPPGPETMASMPALLTGRIVQEEHPRSQTELRIRFLSDDHFVSLGTAPSAFSDVHSLGAGTALVGWYHPYCSILRDLDFCSHAKTSTAVPGILARGNVLDKITDQTAVTIWGGPWASKRFERFGRELHASENSFLASEAEYAVRMFRSGLLIVHLPVPHPPAVSGTGMYFSNLTAADEELARIRKLMEDAQTWNDTAVIVTSDHWWRTHTFSSDREAWTAPELDRIDSDADRRVPFIVKLPEVEAAQTYTRPFNVVLTRELVVALLNGGIRTPSDLRAWLDAHRKKVFPHAYVFVPPVVSRP